MPRSFRFIFPPWLAALKTIETQTPVHLVDLLIDLRDLFRIASGGGKKLYNLLLNYRVDLLFLPRSPLTMNFKGYLKDR